MSRYNLNFGTGASLQSAYDGSLAQPGPAVIQTSGGLPVDIGPFTMRLNFSAPGKLSGGLAPLTFLKTDQTSTVIRQLLSPVDAGDTGTNVFYLIPFNPNLIGGFLQPNTGRVKFAARLPVPVFSPTQGEVISEVVLLADCDPSGVLGTSEQVSTSTFNPNYSSVVQPLVPLGGGTFGNLGIQILPYSNQEVLFRSFPGRVSFSTYLTS